MRRVVIIGGGAAGMAAAIASARRSRETGTETWLYEKNEKLGKKLFITGKGRCNVTNACDMDELSAGIVSNPRFLYSSFRGFTNRDMMKLLEACGCPLKIERGNRVFPVSDKSSDVLRALTRLLEENGVRIHLREEAERVIVTDGRCEGIVLKRGGRRVEADAVIVATGGLSYPSTGSTGDGYAFAGAAGHTVTDLSPALVPLETEEEVVKELQGLSLKNVEAAVLRGDKVLYREFGEMMFTHYGVSGPVLLSASSYAAKALRKGPLILSIDLKPALSEQQLDARILRDFGEFANKQYKNALVRLFPAKLVPVMVKRSGISPDKQVNEITRQERRRLVELTKSFCLTLTGLRGYSEAIITQGGVSVKEIDPKTMESKKTPGLFFAGEVLDLDGVTGGYNLQIAWSTGWAAGTGTAAHCDGGSCAK